MVNARTVLRLGFIIMFILTRVGYNTTRACRNEHELPSIHTRRANHSQHNATQPILYGDNTMNRREWSGNDSQLNPWPYVRDSTQLSNEPPVNMDGSNKELHPNLSPDNLVINTHTSGDVR